MSQDLLDLLALQKIKSEKESAARQMQLQMGQQAAAQGGDPPTIAQQREKEVMDLTKNELAQQRGDTAQQQTNEQQQAMQRMMGGIAGAPGAASAAQPKMMATGGIVAFSGGGETSPAGRAVRGALSSMQTQGKEQAERQMLRDALIEKYRGAAGPIGLFKSQSDEQRAKAQAVMSRLNSMSTSEMKALLGQEPTVSPAYPDEFTRGSAANTMAAPPVQPKPPATPAPTGLAGMPGAQGAPSTVPRPAPAPAPAPAPGVPGAAPMAPAPPVPGAAPAAPGFEDIITQGIQSAASADPMKQGQAYGQSVQERLAFPEERERRRKAIEEQRSAYGEEFDPETQKRERLKRYLIGAGGRRYGEFAGGAQAGMAYDEDQKGAKRERLKGIEDMEQGLFSLRKDATTAGIGAESKRMGEVEDARKSGIASGVQQLGTYAASQDKALDRTAQAQEKALDRKLEQAKIQILANKNKIDQGVMDYTRLQNSKVDYEKLINEATQVADKKFQPLIDAQALPMAGSDPAKKKQAQQAISDLQLQRDAEVATKTKALREEINKLSSMQRGSGTGGMPEGFSRVGER
jgi:hypothetical protein